MMIQKLLEELKSIDDDEENDWLNLSSAVWSSDDLNLSFILKDLSENAIVSKWLVKCVDVISYVITDAYGGGLNYHEDDHPAITQFTDPQVMLHFKGRAKSAPKLIIDLWDVHKKVADDWIPFETYINNSRKLQELISGGYGLLADGPRFLIDEYERVLKNHSIRPSRTKEVPYKRWIENRFEPIIKPVAMIHFGESFIIAKKFEAEKLKGT
jgi:hypothetical protein